MLEEFQSSEKHLAAFPFLKSLRQVSKRWARRQNLIQNQQRN